MGVNNEARQQLYVSRLIYAIDTLLGRSSAAKVLCAMFEGAFRKQTWKMLILGINFEASKGGRRLSVITL